MSCVLISVLVTCMIQFVQIHWAVHDMCAIWGTYFIYLNKKSQNSYKNNKIQSPNASGSSSSCKGLLNINEHLLAYPFPFLSTIMILPFTIRQKLKFQKEHSYELCGSSPSVCRYCSLIMLLQEKERYTHLNGRQWVVLIEKSLVTFTLRQNGLWPQTKLSK